MSLRLDYESAGFNSSSGVANGSHQLGVTWDHLLAAALTVGRPNRHYVFRHGPSSAYEALFRLSLIRMALEQQSTDASKLRRTAAARTLDPSEKGAVNYFLGLALAKMFATMCLNVSWLLHLDVFRPQLNAVLVGRSRPDLVGQRNDGTWIVMECKGRLSPPGVNVKAKAKAQAQRVISVNGAAPAMAIGAITFFRSNLIRFFWEDPTPRPEAKQAISVQLPEESWRWPYDPLLGLLRAAGADIQSLTQRPGLTEVPGADVAVAIRPAVLRRLMPPGQPRGAHQMDASGETQQIRYQSDGVAVVAGPSWRKPFDDAADVRRLG